jgi:hypothetical protein
VTRNPAGGQRRRTSRHPIVDENRGLAAQTGTERAVPETNGTQFELAAFALLDGRELVRRHSRGNDDFVVQDAHANRCRRGGSHIREAATKYAAPPHEERLTARSQAVG